MAEPEFVEKSELALAIEQRERKLYPFDVEGFFGLGDKGIPKLLIRVLMKSEDNASIVAAHHLARSLARDDKDARSVPELLDDLKLKEAIQRSCFLADETKAGHREAFPGGKWMEENMSTDQIAVIWNLMEEVKKAESPMLYKIQMEDVMALAEGCAKTVASDIPEALLAGCNRNWLSSAFVLLASKWWALEQQQRMIDDVLSGEGNEQRTSQRDEGDQKT